MVMMDNKGEAHMLGTESSWKIESSDGEWNRDMVALLMIKRRGVEKGEEDLEEEASKLLIEHLGIGLDFGTCLST